MRKLTAAGMLAAGALGFGFQANAQLVYDISGEFNQTDNSCTAIVFGIGGGDCSYANGRGSGVVWFGPSDGAKYYELGSAGDSTSEQPAAPTYAAPVTGSITINDGGTGPLGTDDTIEGEIIIGAVARSLAVGQVTRGVERWDSMTWTFPATAVSAAVANGNGGFDYIVGSKGFPIPICNVDTPALCFPTASYAGISPPILPDDSFDVPWSGPDPGGVGIEATAVLTPGGNVGASPVVTFSNYTCDIVNTTTGNPGPECTAPSTANSPTLLGAPVSANIATPTDRWGNLVMRIATNNAGQITEAEVYWTREYYIRFPNSLPAPPQPANSWGGGGFSFTGSIPGPAASNDTFSVARGSAGNVLDVMANDRNFADPVTVLITTPPAHGTAIVTGSPGNAALVRIEYTPQPGYAGPDSLVYSVNDGAALDDALVSITVVAPTANDDAAQTRIGTPVAIAVLANDVGFSSPVTVTLLEGPEHGTAQVANSPGSASAIRINYTPAAGYSGPDSLTYQVSDGVNTDSATVSIAVLAYKANDDSFVLLADCCYEYLDVLANDVGFANPVTVTITQLPGIGDVFVSGSPGSAGNVRIAYYPWYWVSAEGYTTTLKYQVSDGSRTDSATVTIRVVPYAAIDDQAVTGIGVPVVIPVADNDVGFNYPRLVGIFTNPTHGSVQVIPGADYYDDPQVVYTPAPGFLGADSFEYSIESGNRVDTALVTVQVINDADGDRVDDAFDNCLGAANADQRDADGDGYGTWCDADFNNDGRVNFADLSAFRVKFGTTDPAGDFNGDGVVSLLDLGRFKALFGGTPGPSALKP